MYYFWKNLGYYGIQSVKIIGGNLAIFLVLMILSFSIIGKQCSATQNIL